MTRGFGAGDRVRCVRTSLSCKALEVGAEYEVRRLDGDGDPILTCEPEHTPIGWPAPWFEKVAANDTAARPTIADELEFFRDHFLTATFDKPGSPYGIMTRAIEALRAA